MEDTPCVLILDCGATSLRAMVVDRRGHIIASSRQPNATVENGADGCHTWDAPGIYRRLGECARAAMAEVDSRRVKAVTVTTFGVDGALVDGQGSLLYPVISWKCPRTAAVMERIGQYMPQEELNRISGVGAFAFNTLYKLVWLRENRPELVERASSWLFISSLFTSWLTGVASTDRTMAGTSQMTDLRTGRFSPDILDAAGLPARLFPPMKTAGEVIGPLLPAAADMLGLGGLALPVVSAGHDTQFAVFGSGADVNQPVLSSGTWEILMVRAPHAEPGPDDYADGATAEYDARDGLVNPGLQWLGSGVIEWIKSLLYPGDSYDVMDDEAERIPPGADGVTLVPEFLPSGREKGSLHGLVLGRTRAHIYRAAMEALSYKLRSRLRRLQAISGFSAQSLIIVGGGSRNRVWNQIRADVLGLPVLAPREAEVTVLGAAMFAFQGAGVYPSAETARQAFALEYRTFRPGPQQQAYRGLIPVSEDNPS